MDAKKAKELVDKDGLDMVDVKFVDVLGTWHHFTVPTHEVQFGHDVLPFDGSSIRGFQEINESDLDLHLDYSTAMTDPFSSKTLTVIADVHDPIKKVPYSRDPRGIAKKAEQYLASTGIADTIYVGPEAEFFIFDHLAYNYNEYSSFHAIDSEEGIWNAGDEDSPNPAYKMKFKGGYFPVSPNDRFQEMRNEMVRIMEQSGMVMERHHHEVATAGQCEIDFRFDKMTRSADNIMMYKYIVKNVAAEYGKVATFMPKPLFNDNGSGMHTHQSLWKDGKNLFAGDGYGDMSETALYYIGGILHHAHAMAAILNPTTNSYKRLVPGFEAPVNLAYSYRNRSAAVRIPVTPKEAVKAKRMEYRSPDPSANPYLAFAVMLMAGIDGIKNKRHPGDPVDGDIYRMSEAQRKNIKQLPGSLHEALDALEADHAFLLEGGVFTKDLIETWIDYKRKNEVDAIRLRPHPYEFYLYHDV